MYPLIPLTYTPRCVKLVIAIGRRWNGSVSSDRSRRVANDGLTYDDLVRGEVAFSERATWVAGC